MTDIPNPYDKMQWIGSVLVMSHTPLQASKASQKLAATNISGITSKMEALGQHCTLFHCFGNIAGAGGCALRQILL